MTPNASEKYDPQYVAAAAKGAATGASFAAREGDKVLHSIHRAAVNYTNQLRIDDIEQRHLLLRAFKAAAHQAYNEARILAA